MANAETLLWRRAVSQLSPVSILTLTTSLRACVGRFFPDAAQLSSGETVGFDSLHAIQSEPRV